MLIDKNAKFNIDVLNRLNRNWFLRRRYSCLKKKSKRRQYGRENLSSTAAKVKDNLKK